MESLPIWTLIPFVLMLLSIAVGPLVAEHWWENNKNKLIVSLILGVPTAIYLMMNGLGMKLEHQILYDYIPFIVLLGSLFIITGGIHLSGDLAPSPKTNVIFLLIGFIFASIMGTTGAAMLLISPLLVINAKREHKVHTVLFFIAIVANCGGMLTPLGDPPLFLLYLRGAEFTWFLGFFKEWAFIGGSLMLIYYAIDTHFYKKEDQSAIQLDSKNIKPLNVTGNLNFLFLIGIVLSVAFINPQFIPEMGDHHAPIYLKFLREIAMVLLIGASWLTTKKEIRTANKFNFEPILEVAALFIGIFVTMTPALIYLAAHASDLGLTESSQFYYITGMLSSFLDNAPTAVAFHTVATGLPESLAATNAGVTAGIFNFNGTDISFVAGVPEILLQGISMGAVFFGAMTYIGNGPNFMVKAIAEQNGIKMPSFFGYMLKFSLIILLPIYILNQIIFL